MTLPFFCRLILRHFFLLLAAGGFSLSAAAQAVDNNNINSANSMALSLISNLPPSGLKDGLKRYYQILNPSSYSSDKEVAFGNTGLSVFFQNHFEKNQCFAEKALLFYRDVRATTKNNQRRHEQEQRHSRPSLGDTAGGSRNDLKAGWLFQKALKYSKGNPNAALALIGMCGHDDQEQGDFVNPKAENSLMSKGLRYEDLYFAESEEDPTVTPCPPQTSDLYIARSLSESADISENIKKLVMVKQYPGRSPLQVASKNYHVLGAAFMTCQMIEAGLNPQLAVKVETMAAHLYRGIRLCQDVEIPANLFWKLQSHPEIKGRPTSEHFEEAVLRKALERGRKNSCSYSKIKEDALCELLMRAGVPSNLKTPGVEEHALRALNFYLDRMIASGLYSSWTLSGRVSGVSLPCSKEQLLGPHPFLKWLVSRAQWPINICGRGLSLESCRKALNVVKTWEVDFTWTVAQHKAGAEFAARVCRPLPVGQNSFDSFCQ